MTTQYYEQVQRQAPWLEDYQRRLLASTETLTGEPYEQFAGPRLAGLSEDQIRAFELTRGGIGAYEPYLEESLAYTRGAPTTFAAAAPEVQELYRGATTAFDPSTQVQQYMNPYQEQVTQQSLDELNRQYEMKGQELAAGAAGSGAFGGARHGVMEAELGRGQAQAQAQMIAQDYARNYMQALQSAQAAHEATAGRQMQAGQGIAGLAQTGAGLMQQAAQQTAGLGGLQQQYGAADVSQLSQAGALQQQQLQKEYDIEQQKFVESQMQPYQRLGYMSDILRGVPTTQATMTAQSAPEPSNLSQGIGALSAMAGIGGQQGFGWWGDKKS